MTRYGGLEINLATVETENPVLDPLPLPVNQPDDFGGSEQSEVVDGEPRRDVGGCIADHRPNRLDRQSLCLRRSEWELSNPGEVDDWDEVAVDGPLQHALDGYGVVVDRLPRVGRVGREHRVTNRKHAGGGHAIGASRAEHGGKPPQLVRVVASGAHVPLGGLRRDEHLLQAHHGQRAGWNGAHAPRSPRLPVLKRVSELREGAPPVSTEVVATFAPLREPSSVGQLLERRDFDVGHRSPPPASLQNVSGCATREWGPGTKRSGPGSFPRGIRKSLSHKGLRTGGEGLEPPTGRVNNPVVSRETCLSDAFHTDYAHPSVKPSVRTDPTPVRRRRRAPLRGGAHLVRDDWLCLSWVPRAGIRPGVGRGLGVEAQQQTARPPGDDQPLTPAEATS